MTSFGWECELPGLAELSDQDAALAINAMTVQDSIYVFASFRTMAALLSATEYNTLRAVFKQAVASEAAQGGSLLSDMEQMLLTPGSEDGSGGGLDITSPGFVSMLQQLCLLGGINDVPQKVADYAMSKQPPLRQKYSTAYAGQVALARMELT